LYQRRPGIQSQVKGSHLHRPTITAKLAQELTYPQQVVQCPDPARLSTERGLPWGDLAHLTDPQRWEGVYGMNIVPLLIQLVSGAAGGNVAGALLKKFSLGPIGNSIAGILGGGLGGQLLGALGVGGADAAAGGLDIGGIVSSIAGGGVGGGVLMSIVGLVRQQLGKSA